MPDVHAALQAAATALLPTASEPMLRQILRDLLADDDPTPTNALGTVQAANALARTAPGAESVERALARPPKSAQPSQNGVVSGEFCKTV